MLSKMSHVALNDDSGTPSLSPAQVQFCKLSPTLQMQSPVLDPTCYTYLSINQICTWPDPYLYLKLTIVKHIQGSATTLTSPGGFNVLMNRGQHRHSNQSACRSWPVLLHSACCILKYGMIIGCDKEKLYIRFYFCFQSYLSFSHYPLTLVSFYQWPYP